MVDFSFDIVEIEKENIAKRGKMSGHKKVYYCNDCLINRVVPASLEINHCLCGGKVKILTKSFIKSGELVNPLPKAKEIRKYVLNQLSHMVLNL